MTDFNEAMRREDDIRRAAVDNVRADAVAARKILMDDLRYETFVTEDIVEIARLIGEERRELDSLWCKDVTE